MWILCVFAVRFYVNLNKSIIKNIMHITKRESKYDSLYIFFLKSQNLPVPPSSSSITNKRLYLATLSVLQGAPVFIWPAFVATATSANVVSSVSPERCDTTAV